MNSLPEVARNFLYRPPKCGILRPRDYLDPTHELTVATSMRREFWWYVHQAGRLSSFSRGLRYNSAHVSLSVCLSRYEKVLWAEDIKCPVVVALSGEDEIVPSHALKHYLTNHHLDCRVLFWPSLGHGQLLLRTEEQEELITAMREQAKRVPGTMGEEDDHNKLKMLQSPSSPSKRKGKKRKGGSSLASSPHGLAKPF